MNAKHLSTLEFPKILARLATYTSFSAGEEHAHALTPATDLQEIRWRLETTSEARALLDIERSATIGGAHDVRPQVRTAQRGKILPPHELLDVRDTLVAAHNLHRTLIKREGQFPRLARLAGRIRHCPKIVTEINRCLDDAGSGRGDYVRDEASSDLARIRREIHIAYDRLQDKLQRILNSSRNATFLQDHIITRRENRYVIPLKANFKGRIPGVVHDVSASGATIFIEPLPIVELNNAWRELQIEEQQEIERILAYLSNLIAERSVEFEQTIEALSDLDLAFSKAKYADDIDAVAPEFVPFHEVQSSNTRHPGSTICLIAARHPLLDPQSVVPIDVVLDEETHVLVITGPNTGGKTVSLKTVGLLTLMAQAGLHIPAQKGSTLSPFESVYADIGDEQSIEQSLSTFSSHLTNIVSFMAQANPRSLILLDELGAGTDPTEGAALARALLDHFRHCGAMTFVATHYPELKSYAQLTSGVQNASVEFDSKTLSPTYELSIGLPGRSNAFAIARHLDLPEEVVEAARQMISPDDLRTEDMLADIHRLRAQATQAWDEASANRAETEKMTRDLRERLGKIEQERSQILEQARERAEAELKGLRAEMRDLRRRLQAAATPMETATALEEEAEALEAEISEPEPLIPPVPHKEPSRPAQRPIRPGDTVWVRPLNSAGQVIEMLGKKAKVQVGPAHTRVRLTDLELQTAPQPELQESPVRIRDISSPGVRLDLRGCTVEEALKQLDRHLDRAMRAGLPQVRIIHGKGSGALRRSVRDFLFDYPLVRDYEAGGPKEGGEGVTIAKVVSA